LLLRMRDENGRIVAPDNFIAARALWNYAQHRSLGDRNAFRWLVSEADERERLAMCSINLSARAWAMTNSCVRDRSVPAQRYRFEQDLL